MVGDSVSRRSFMQNVGLVTGGIAAWSSAAGCGQTAANWSKKRLVQVLSGVHNFLTTPFFPISAWMLKGYAVTSLFTHVPRQKT